MYKNTTMEFNGGNLFNNKINSKKTKKGSNIFEGDSHHYSDSELDDSSRELVK